MRWLAVWLGRDVVAAEDGDRPASKGDEREDAYAGHAEAVVCGDLEVERRASGRTNRCRPGRGVRRVGRK